MALQLGLDTFGDITRDADGTVRSHAQVIRDVIAEAELADRVGVAFFGVGEHHRADFAISAPEVVAGQKHVASPPGCRPIVIPINWRSHSAKLVVCLQ